MIRRFPGLALATLAAALAFAPPAAAQAASEAPGPTLTATSSALRASTAVTERVDSQASLTVLQQPRRPFGQAEALMIIGGAALLAGAIIGGDAGTIVMLGGAGVGLYGLYLFLQ